MYTHNLSCPVCNRSVKDVPGLIHIESAQYHDMCTECYIEGERAGLSIFQLFTLPPDVIRARIAQFKEGLRARQESETVVPVDFKNRTRIKKPDA